MADLTPRIEKLLGSLAGARRPPGQALTQVEAPPTVLRAGDPGFAAAVAHLVGMPLDQYGHDGAPLEVRVPWHGETLWFVADDRQAEALAREGVSRGRIWTAGELSALMALPDLTPELVRRLAGAKREFDAWIVEVRRR